jgi:DNA-binding SARP family transcriptional activator
MHIMSAATMGPPVETGSPVAILALGRFDIYLAGTRLRFEGKTPHKPLDLLKGLLVAGGRGVSRRILCDALWPDLDSWLSRQALNAAVFRLRGILKNKDLVRLDGELLSLEAARCRVDAWEFENGISQIGAPDAVLAAMQRYQGPFLGDCEHPLAFEARDRLRRKFVRGTVQLGQTHERRGEFDDAVSLYHRALDIEQGIEELHRVLIGCLTRAGQVEAAAAAYHRCLLALEQAGSIPSPSVHNLYRDIAISIRRL